MMIGLDSYLAILKSMSTEDHPYMDHPTGAEELGAAATAMSHAVAEFVEVARVHLGYEVARDTLEDLVHTFPTTEAPLTPEAMLQLALLDALGRIPADLLGDEPTAQ